MAKKKTPDVPVEVTEPEEPKAETPVEDKPPTEDPLIAENMLTVKEEKETALVPSDQADALFGDEQDVPVGALPPQIKIQKDDGKFNIGGITEDELIGHILFIQPHNVYYEGKFDPSDPLPPMCTSANSIKSDGGTDPQSEFCAGCKQNVHDKDLKCRPCKNRILIYFLREDDAFPSIIDLAATNLSKKAGEQRIMAFPATGQNMSFAAGMGKHYQLVKVRLTLNTVTFGNGSASTLNVECLETVKDMKQAKIIARTTDGVKQEYMQIAKTLAQEAIGDGDGMADDDCPI